MEQVGKSRKSQIAILRTEVQYLASLITANISLLGLRCLPKKISVLFDLMYEFHVLYWVTKRQQAYQVVTF